MNKNFQTLQINILRLIFTISIIIFILTLINKRISFRDKLFSKLFIDYLFILNSKVK